MERALEYFLYFPPQTHFIHSHICF
jgi:hypothetical protein